MKAHPRSSGLLLIVNAAQMHQMVERSWTDGEKIGTISTVFIKDTEGAMGYISTTQKQCKEVEGSVSNRWDQGKCNCDIWLAI